MTYEQAKVQEVSWRNSGGELAASVPVGATVLPLYDAYDFNESGGSLEIDGKVYAYLSWDDEDQSVELATPLTAAAGEGTDVLIYPRGAILTAMVTTYDEDEGVRAIIPLELRDRFDDGIRDPASREEVLISDERGRWEIVGLDDEIPKVDGRYLDPVTVPRPIPDAPTVTPAPIVTGGIKVFYVSWLPSAETFDLLADVHISREQGFTPTPLTLVKTVNATMTTIEAEADGSDLQSGVDYFIRVVYRNISGTAPASPEASGRLRLIDTPDISLNAAWVGTMNVDRLTGGIATFEAVLSGSGGIVSRGAAGEEVAQRSTGLTVKGPTALGNPVYVDFPTEGGRPTSTVKTLRSETVEVEGDPETGRGATLRGITDVPPGSVIRLANKTQPPISAPSVTIEYDQVPINWNGHPEATYLVGGYWHRTNQLFYFLDGDLPTQRMYWANADGVVQGSMRINRLNGRAYGLTYIAGQWHILHIGTIARYPYACVSRLDLAGNLLATWSPHRLSIGLVATGGIGTDGSHLIVGSRHPYNDGLYITEYLPNVPNGQSGSTYVSSEIRDLSWAASDWSTNGRIASIHGESSDLPEGRVVIGQTKRILVYSSTRQNGDEWPVQSDQVGVYWNGSSWVGLSRSGTFVRYTNWKPPANSRLYAVNTKVQGSYESTMSPIGSVKLAKRSQVRITVGYAGAEESNLYLAQGTTAPTRTGLFAAALLTSPMTTYVLTNTPDVLGVSPPSVSNFPGEVPAGVVSDDGRYTFDADGNLSAKTIKLDGVVRAKVYRSGTNQNIAHATETRINFNDEEYDTNNLASGGSTITIPTAGIYAINLNAQWVAFDVPSMTGKQVSLHLDVDGIFKQSNVLTVSGTNNRVSQNSLSWTGYLAAGVVIAGMVYHNLGATQALNYGAGSATASGTYLEVTQLMKAT